MTDRVSHRFSWPRVLAAIVVGLTGAGAIGVMTPYNNFLLHNGFISDDFLPTSVLFIFLLIALVLNPLLRLAGRRWTLNSAQLALIFGMLLLASVPTSSGLLRMLPYSVARQASEVSVNKTTAEYYRAADLPPSLFPVPLVYHTAIGPVRDFLLELPGGQGIPWRAWLKPALSWSGFALAWWVMMIGLAAIVLPQWLRNERLPFPLLTVMRELIQSPAGGGILPPIFRRKSFWIAAGGVFALHLLSGLKIYFPQRVPAIPLQLDLSPLFTEEPLSYLPDYIKGCQIYFVFLGVTFFMSNRVGFSIWFFALAYAIYTVIGNAWLPPFQPGIPNEHRTGAMLALTVSVLWLGRAHWRHVFACLWRGGGNDRDRRDRLAGILFLTGCGGLFAWLVWCGAQPGWACFLVAMAFVYALMITRVVAETGLSMIGFYPGHLEDLLRMFPVALVKPATAWLAGVVALFAGHCNRVSVGVMATHALGLEEQAAPRRQSRVTLLLIGVLGFSLLVSGAVHLHMNYHHSSSLDGTDRPVNSWGTYQFDSAFTLLGQQQNGKWDRPVYSRAVQIGFGAALAGALQWACLTVPQWPLHPVGLLIIYTWYSSQTWLSVLIGWVLKNLLLRYGGAHLYSAARPFFIGLIIGEVGAAIFWGIVPAVLTWFDLPYKIVQIMPV